MTINERIRKLRKEEFKISMEEFGGILGISKSGISEIESGRRNVTDQHIKLLTSSPIKGKQISESWLRDGKEPMFIPNPQDEISQIVKKYHLVAGMEAVFRQMAQLPDDAQEALLNFIKKTARELNEEAEMEKLESEMSANADTSQDNMDTESGSRSKVLSLEEIRALPLEERMKIMDSVSPEELGLSNLVARKSRKDKDNK